MKNILAFVATLLFIYSCSPAKSEQSEQKPEARKEITDKPTPFSRICSLNEHNSTVVGGIFGIPPSSILRIFNPFFTLFLKNALQMRRINTVGIMK